jgi:hypothetical protein
MGEDEQGEERTVTKGGWSPDAPLRSAVVLSEIAMEQSNTKRSWGLLKGVLGKGVKLIAKRLNWRAFSLGKFCLVEGEV